MGGICGWIGADHATLARDGAGMLSALSHRGTAVWLDWLCEATVAADSSFNTPATLASEWSTWMADPCAFVSRLEGSFAVAALDRRNGRLVLGRDRLGEKPLYYTAGPSGVAFASEIKALRAGGMIPDLSLSPSALDSYLAFTYVPAPRTIFSAVRKVPAGHCVVIDLRGLADGSAPAVQTLSYWKLPDRIGAGATSGRMLEMLIEALRRRLPPVGSAGAFLSGGLDSSVVVTLMARELGRRVPAFSIGFAEGDLDESVHARRVAELAGAEHHPLTLRDVEPDLVARVISQLDEPMADAATIPTYLLAREASGVTPVVMTGDGADAVLAGDHWFRRLRTLDALERLPRALRMLTPALAAAGGPRRYAKYRDLVALLDRPAAERYLRIREKWTHEERLAVYSEEFRRRVDVSVTQGSYLLAPVVFRPGESVDAALHLDSMHGLPEGLLMKADKMGMAHGVESRSPFLDQRLVEFTARLEIGLLLKGSTSKYLLKKAAESLLPGDLIYRRKHGFQVPLARWLKGCLRDLTEAAFDPGLIDRQGIFDAAALGRIKSRFESGAVPAALAGQVWQVVAFQTWWRQVFDPARS